MLSVSLTRKVSLFQAAGGGGGGLPSGEGRLEFRHLRISNAPDSGLYIENKNGGPFLVVQNVTLRNVSTRESSEAPIHIGSGPYHCERHCCSEGASFDGVVLYDSVDRVPLEVQGNVSRMSGAVTVHNPALSPSRCVSALPELHVACDHNRSPLRSDDDAAQGARSGGRCGAGAASSGKGNCAGTGNVAGDFVLRAKVTLAHEDDALLVHMAAPDQPNRAWWELRAGAPTRLWRSLTGEKEDAVLVRDERYSKPPPTDESFRVQLLRRGSYYFLDVDGEAVGYSWRPRVPVGTPSLFGNASVQAWNASNHTSYERNFTVPQSLAWLADAVCAAPPLLWLDFG